MYYENDWLLFRKSYPAVCIQKENRLILSNTLISRTFCISPDFACISLRNETTGEEFLRGVKPELILTLDGSDIPVGGLSGQPDYAYLKEEWLSFMRPHKDGFHFHSYTTTQNDRSLRLSVKFAKDDLCIMLHYEILNDYPVMLKWFEIQNNGTEVLLDSFRGEIIAVCEHEATGSETYRINNALYPRNITVTSDFSTTLVSTTYIETDPDYTTQVDYLSMYKCLIVSRPMLGPHRLLKKGDSFTSFKTIVMLHENTEKERRTLSLLKIYERLAPHCSDSPLLLHVTSTDFDIVSRAVDQCAQTGFEMIILSFGSSLNMESDDPEYIAKIKRLTDYAHSKGIRLGGYSLLASRSVGKKDDIVNPSPIFGNSPCLCSEWGYSYFDRLKNFIEKTEFDMLEHDGSYPGDTCASTDHPHHTCYEDSYYRQMEKIREFYAWCRSRNMYLNVPDWYILQGTNKTGMGYKEVNWSLPREYQLLITRQNIYDGTYDKCPTMGWMFVPLTQYHGGGESATIEPLCEHLEHYRAILNNNLLAGVQACYRGYRAYDTEETKQTVKKAIDFFKANRAILEKPFIHLRRPDGRDYDGYLHVDPTGKIKGMLVLFNPLSQDITREITVPLYYTGLSDKAVVGGTEYPLDRFCNVKLSVTIPARGFVVYGVTGVLE